MLKLDSLFRSAAAPKPAQAAKAQAAPARPAALGRDAVALSKPAQAPPDGDAARTSLAQAVYEAKYGPQHGAGDPSHLKLLRAIYSPSWLFNTALDQPPREMKGAADVITRKADGTAPAGSTPDSRLREAILAQPGPLQPADVLRLSVKANGGNYFMGALTAHNLLKDCTSTERRLKLKRDVPADVAEADRAVIQRLASLRSADSANAGDKMGPWYHTFGLVTFDAASTWVLGEHSHVIDRLASEAEHPKFLKPGFWRGLAKVVETVGFHTGPAEHLASWLLQRHPFGGADPEKAALDDRAVSAIKLADGWHDDGHPPAA